MTDTMMAKASGTALPVSRKQCIEVCRMINKKPVQKAVKMLQRVKLLKMAVPYTKFKRDIPHRAGSVGPGRFPIKAAGFVLGLVESAVKNAEHKGMKSSSLFISKASACKGPTAWRNGRQSRRLAKRTNVYIELEEMVEKKKAVKAAVKAEAKPAEKKEANEVAKAPSEEKQ